MKAHVIKMLFNIDFTQEMKIFLVLDYGLKIIICHDVVCLTSKLLKSFLALFLVLIMQEGE